MPADRMVRSASMALVMDSGYYLAGSLFSDCQGIATTCGNGIESCNLGRQSGVAIVTLCFLSDFLLIASLMVYNE